MNGVYVIILMLCFGHFVKFLFLMLLLLSVAVSVVSSVSLASAQKFRNVSKDISH